MKTWAKKDSIVAGVKAYADGQVAAGDREDVKRFIDGFYGASAPEDIINLAVSDLFAVAHSMWRLAASRKRGQVRLKVFNPKADRDGWETPHTVIQIVNDDMPFLVDSVTGGLNITMRYGIHAVHHPIFVVHRDDKGERQETLRVADPGDDRETKKMHESCIHIEIDACSDAAQLKEIEAHLLQVLEDVQLAVADWKAMMAKIDETVASLTVHPTPAGEDLNDETIGYLRWLAADHFTFLGFREYRFEGDPKSSDFNVVEGSGLGILRDPSRYILRGKEGLTAISPEIRHFLTLPEPMIITKANIKAMVHRQVHLDYVGVKIFDAAGRVIGERRFVGLFTSLSYSRSPLEVPLLRFKVSNVAERSGFDPRSHAGKALGHILENFPRDELFQIAEDGLLETSLGILHLLERPRARAFIRRDKFERFISALVYVPRDNYNSILRKKVEQILCDAFNGEISVYYAQLSEDVIARWHFIIRTKPGHVPDVDMSEINERLMEAAKDWSHHLYDALLEKYGEEDGNRLVRAYTPVFSLAYRDDFTARQAVIDIENLEELAAGKAVGFDIYRRRSDADCAVRLKIYHASEVVPLSDCLPMLEHLGLRVINENSYELQDESGGCVHDFFLESEADQEIDAAGIKPIVEELLTEVWCGNVEDDAFNALAIEAGLDWQEIVVFRAYAKYFRQIGLPFSQDYVASCLTQYPEIARKILRLFAIQFDPAGPAAKTRQDAAGTLSREILHDLDQVSSLDRDRILRTYVAAVGATLRTNFYQDAYRNPIDDRPRPGLAFKIRSSEMDEAPKPRPFVEIFVYSPRVEGVHLRGGMVARGGLRWSDRPEDFRTEVLGLVKAQQVKNAVIVPVGAKGGFVPKRLPTDGGREAWLEEGIGCYRIFITSLLGITDNLVKGKIAPPAGTVRRDGDDPYLVVAADKGTATFSDIANGLALDHDFWLGDAFASGGSVGYDHKKMGITAKGAWVSVQRHFREMGLNIQKDVATVIGIGDMSGDVFGNGMLLSKALKLQAAFDHRHIFIDPDPDPAESFKERRRLFKLARSSWEDYDRALISKGGGIFPRSAKTIALTPEIRAFLGIDAKSLSPLELINAILKARADLLWFGGIGTYVKASYESHGDAGDRANDLIRVDATELNVRVVGEGGNLGMTQEARIEFAQAGGHVNTDFIDNSAGVDCSDKEVNIKILLADAVASGGLGKAARDQLLAEMTGEVSDIVLEDNYLQTQAISMAQAQALKSRENHAGLIRSLERAGRLDRVIENLPTEEQFSEMALNQDGMVRPEIATLLAYAKMAVNDALVESPLMDDAYFVPELGRSFPKVLRAKYEKQLKRHRLRREIIATTLANEVINRAGLTFVHEVREETGLPTDQIVAAYVVVRDAFGLSEVWPAIDALDYKVPSAIQTLMHIEVGELIKHQAVWFLHALECPIDIKKAINKYREGLRQLLEAPNKVLSKLELESFKSREAMFREQNVPAALARRVASLEALGAACDIVRVSDALARNVIDVGKGYFDIGYRIGFAWLRQTAEAISSEDHWDRLAVHALMDDFADQQRVLTQTILKDAQTPSATKAVQAWTEAHASVLVRAERLLSDLKSSGQVTVGKLSFAARHLRALLPKAG